MKIKVEEQTTSRGMREFIELHPENADDGLLLGRLKLSIGNGSIYSSQGKMRGSFDPEYVAKWIDTELFASQLDDECICKLTVAITAAAKSVAED